MKTAVTLLTSILILSSGFCFAENDHLALNDAPGWIPNLGQIHNQHYERNSDVTHLWASGRGMNVQLRNNGLSYDTYSQSGDKILFHRLDMTLLGASPEIELSEEAPFGNQLNIYNPLVSKGVSTAQFGRIVLGNVYPGIDVVCTVNGEKESGVKYDFVVHSGGDVDQIRMKYEGFDQVEVSDTEIRFELSGKTLVESIPQSWTLPGNRQATVQYRIIEESARHIIVGLEWVDASELMLWQSLVIDPLPVLEWGTYQGDSLYDAGTSITTDTLGSVYVSGNTRSLLSIASSGSFQSEYNGGNSDAFISKFNKHGMRVWSSYFGGSGDDYSSDISLNGLFEVFVVGNTTSVDSLTTESAYQMTNAGGTDVFAAKFDSSGVRIWSTFLGGMAGDTAMSCVADTSGNVFIAGYSTTGDWLTTGSVQPEFPFSGGTDAFIVKIDTAGMLSWSTFYGGAENDYGNSIAIDSLHNIFLAGSTFSLDGIATEGTHQAENSGDEDAFVVCFNPDGSRKWGTYFGGSEKDVSTGIVAFRDAIYATGFTQSDTAIADTSAHQPLLGGEMDAFLCRLDTTGSVTWSTYFGDSLTDWSAGIDVDLLGNVYITGTTNSENAISTYDVHQDWLRGEYDVFIAKFDSSGTRVWGTYYGGVEYDQAADVAIYGVTAVYITGQTNSEYFIDYFAHQHELGGGISDAYVARLTLEHSTGAAGVCTCNGSGSGSGTGGGGGGGSGGGSGGGGDGSNQSHPHFLVCYGDSIQLSVMGGALGQNCEWVWYAHGCGGDGDHVAVGGTVWLTPDTNTTYYVRAEGGSYYTHCVKVDLIAVDKPTAVATANDILCSGDSLFLSAESGEYYLYEWTGPNEFTSYDQHPVIDSISSINSGWYFLTVSNAPNCWDTDSVYVEVLEHAQYDVSITDPGCVGSSDGSIVVSVPDSTNLDFHWSGYPDSGDTLSGVNAGFYVLNIGGTGICTSVDTISITAPPSLVDTVLVTATSCGEGNGAIEILLNEFSQEVNFSWNPDVSQNSMAEDLSPGDYEITISDSTCTDSVSVSISESEGIAAEWLNIQHVSCPIGNNGSLEVSVSNGSPPYSFTWSVADSANAFLDSLMVGYYSVTVIDSIGCAITLEAEITQPDSMVLTADIVPEICRNEAGSIQLETEQGEGEIQYLWLHDESTGSFLENLTSGEYTVEVTDLAGCTITESFVVPDEGWLMVEIFPDGAEIESGQSVELNTIVSPDSLTVTYLWEPSEGLSCDDCPDPVATPEETTTYILTAMSDEGCEDQAGITIVVEELCPEFFVPNIFSPNGDGLNDEFCVFGGCIEEFQLTIYNRWGELVFETSDPQVCWDGAYNGESITSGAMVYTVSAILENGETIEDSGNLIIQR